MTTLRYSVCNELFGSLPLVDAARIVKRAGYSGVEFAPYTIFGDFSPGSIRHGIDDTRKILSGEGLTFIGFHWLLAKPDGLHTASPDPVVRKKTVDHLKLLAECAAELGGGVLVFGSPRQRGSIPGVSVATAVTAFREALEEIAPTVAACGCSILIESLSKEQTDVVNTLKEAVTLVKAINHPAVSSMFDFRNASDESESWDFLIDTYYNNIRHVHANEVDGRAPGTGNSDYLPSFRTLIAHGYPGWVSVEIFHTPPDPEKILTDSMDLFIKLQSEGERS